MMAEVDIVRVLRLRAEDEDISVDDAVLLERAAARIEVLSHQAEPRQQLVTRPELHAVSSPREGDPRG